MSDERPKLLLLHALPLDVSMWVNQMDLLPADTVAPSLYGFGDRIESWAASALAEASGNRLVVVGCSVGGSCALEIAALAPERVAALVLIGTKADHRPEPALRDAALRTIATGGLDAAWEAYWAPLFSPHTPAEVVAKARALALRQSPLDVARGISVFHGRQSRGQVFRNMTCPIVIVTGADDVAPGPETSWRQVEMARRGRLHVIPDCGHYVPLERPNALNDILREVILESREATYFGDNDRDRKA
jgi:pimeloyl-ACP methyl ester carboxylesterase